LWTSDVLSPSLSSSIIPRSLFFERPLRSLASLFFLPSCLAALLVRLSDPVGSRGGDAHGDRRFISDLSLRAPSSANHGWMRLGRALLIVQDQLSPRLV